MSADTTSSNLKQWSQNQEFGKIASFFTSLTGSPDQAKELLQNVVDSLSNDNTSRKRHAPLPASVSTPSASQTHSFLVQDALDEAVVTSLIQIPNEKSVIGAIIGPQGKHIKQMTLSTGCVVNLDQKSQSAQSRTAPITVFLQGPLRSLVKVAEMLSTKVESVAAESGGNMPWTGSGSGANRTSMIIPDSLVKRVIGRGGSTVTKIQQDSKAAIQLQNEAKMMSSPDPLFGREALLTGPLDARLHGLYLICRLLLEDKECPASWITSNQFPTPIRGGMGGGSSMVMTAKGVFGAPVPPQPHQLGQGQGQRGAYPPQQLQLPVQVQRSAYSGMGQVPVPAAAPSSLSGLGGSIVGVGGASHNQFQQPTQPPIQPPQPSQMGQTSQMMSQQMLQPSAIHSPYLPLSYQQQKK